MLMFAALALAADRRRRGARRRGRGRRLRGRPRGGELSEEVWRTPRRSTRSCSASRTTAASAESAHGVPRRLRRDHPLREGSRVRHRRRTGSSPTSRAAIGDSPCDWIHVLIDSYHDKRTAYEFAVNPSGVKIDRYWYNDNNRDDSWDAVWDVKRLARSPTAGPRSSASRSRSCASTQSDANTFGFAVSRQIGRLNETSTWPLLARSANGYVSSFGELGGLSMARSPKQLELVPYARGQPDAAAAPAATRCVKRPRAGGVVGLDMKYALTPGLTLTGDHQPGLRPGRSRSRGREPDRVRNVLLRAAAVLRRGIRQRSTSTRLQRRRVHRLVLFSGRIGRVAAGHRRSAERRRRLHRRAGADRRSSARRS